MVVRGGYSTTSICLRGGNYGGKDGVIHGMPQGPLKVTGEGWDLLTLGLTLLLWDFRSMWLRLAVKETVG